MGFTGRYTVRAHKDTSQVSIRNNYMAASNEFYFTLKQVDAVIEALQKAKGAVESYAIPEWDISDYS